MLVTRVTNTRSLRAGTCHVHLRCQCWRTCWPCSAALLLTRFLLIPRQVLKAPQRCCSLGCLGNTPRGAWPARHPGDGASGWGSGDTLFWGEDWGDVPIHGGHHGASPDWLLVGLQRRDKMLYLRECGQHNSMLTVNLEDYFLSLRRENKRQVQLFPTRPKPHC